MEDWSCRWEYPEQDPSLIEPLKDKEPDQLRVIERVLVRIATQRGPYAKINSAG